MTGTSLSPTRLPKARALTETLVAPPTVDLDEAPEDLYRQLAQALTAAATQLPAGSVVRVDGYFFRTALTAPEQLSHPDPFEWSPRTARRLLGLAAVRACVCGSERTPADAVEHVVAAAIEDARRGSQRSGSLASWLLDLATGGRAVVRAEAVTWATQLLAALEWRSLGATPIVGSDQWWDGAAGLPRRPARSIRGPGTDGPRRSDAGSLEARADRAGAVRHAGRPPESGRGPRARLGGIGVIHGAPEGTIACPCGGLVAAVRSSDGAPRRRAHLAKHHRRRGLGNHFLRGRVPEKALGQARQSGLFTVMKSTMASMYC